MTMDLQRSLLIGAIAVLSFMLLTEWQTFKDEKSAIVAESTSRIISNGNNLESVPADVPLAMTSDEFSEDDIPHAEEVVNTDTTPEIAPSINSARIIQIHTDVLKIAIDLAGGDIIEAALPAFLEKLDNPDVPFVLLEQNERRIYIAQSGLIGPDGIDKKGERALFTTAKNEFTLKEGQDKLEVDLNWKNDDGVSITKRFTVERGGSDANWSW